MEALADYFLAGLTRGSTYALIALGYTMVYGIIGLINFAHGEIYMIGAFVGLVAAATLAHFGFSETSFLAAALASAVIFACAYGWTIERLAYRRLRSAPRLSALITAIGMSLFLQNYVLVSQGAEFKAYPNLVDKALGVEEANTLAFLQGEVQEAPLLQGTEWAILIAAAISMLALMALIRHTRLGRAMRAVAQDRSMAQLLGVDVNRTVSAAFVIGSAFAALGGVLVASHNGQLNFYFGFIAGIKAFTAAVLGGIGSIPGAALGGILLGMVESFSAGFIRSDYEDIIAFLVLVTVLIFKPEGLLGRSTDTRV